MINFLTPIICSVIVLTACNGCSFIKEHFSNNNQQMSEEQNNEQQEERKPEPIPVSPPHS